MTRSSSKENTARLFNRYVWLVDLVYRYSGHITFEEINERWLNSELNVLGEDLPLKTFHNHKSAIKTMFDINIGCNLHNGYTYYIDNAEDMERGGARQWLVNTFAINNLINESHKLKHRILFENIPSGQQHLTPIIEAMRDSLALEISYHSFYRDSASTFEVEPLCVKVFRQRWYLVGNSDKGVRIYALDRLTELRTTDRKFAMPKDFDPQRYFAHCFGISKDSDIYPEIGKLRVSTANYKDLYLQSLPLHHSQTVEEQSDKSVIFSYYLRPTYDFRMEVLSHGADMEVLAPKWFRDEIASIIKAQSKFYQRS